MVVDVEALAMILLPVSYCFSSCVNGMVPRRINTSMLEARGGKEWSENIVQGYNRGRHKANDAMRLMSDQLLCDHKARHEVVRKSSGLKVERPRDQRTR